MSKKIVKQILKNKKPIIAEIELTLFENCDQNCAFCSHDKGSLVGLSTEEIYEKLQVVYDFIETIDEDIRIIQVQLVGGELLQDYLIDNKFLNDYSYVLNKIKEHLRESKRQLQVMVVSNFLFTKTKKVGQWMKRLNQKFDAHLIASYDITGRVINQQWKDNVEALSEHMGSINMVATEPTIKRLLKGNNDYFDYLYNNFNIFIDTFIPDERTENLIPSDDLYLAYLKFMTVNYPKVQPLEGVISGTPDVRMDCMSLNKITIFPDNTTSNCRWKRYKQRNFNSKLVYEDNSNIMMNYLNDNDCLSCQYYQRCPLRCFVQWDWTNRERSKGCVMKKWFYWMER